MESKQISHNLDVVSTHFRLKRPCKNCPFRKTGGIELEPGRLQGIVDDLASNDQATFQCHETVHGKSGGEWNDEGQYEASGKEAMCAGAMIYLEKLGRPTVTMRLGQLWRFYKPQALLAHEDAIIDPGAALLNPPSQQRSQREK